MLHSASASKLVLGLCAAALLSACSNLKQLEKANPQPSDFNNSLATEYLAFADSEADQYDWKDADYFAKKGLDATKGKEVAPEELKKWKLPADKQEALSSSRERLVNVLSPEVKQSLPQKAARTQALFDCWVEQQEENWQPEDIASCSVDFMNALQELEALKPAFIVYFNTGSTSVSKADRKATRALVKYLKTLDNYEIFVTGHTDTVGGDKSNQRLSDARVKAVKNMLVNHGVKRKRIAGDGLGQTQPVVETGDNVSEALNRRVVITIKQ